MAMRSLPASAARPLPAALRRRAAASTRVLSTHPTAAPPPPPLVNAHHTPDPWVPPHFSPIDNSFQRARVSAEHWQPDAWSTADLRALQHEHVVGTWGPTSAIRNIPMLERGEGVYLYDVEGKKYIDWTSQAICTNLGYSVPAAVMESVTEQLHRLPHVYGGLGMVEIRCRLSKLMAEIMPGDINGFLFPTGGAEANEAAVRIARRYTGRHKVINLYRSYHGGTAATLSATGDFRRWFTGSEVSGFVKAFNPTPINFSWGDSPEQATEIALAALEEQIMMEGPGEVAAIMLESIVGSGGTLVAPAGYLQGVRALCDKYNIVYIADEVMVGFGRTGKLWGFQHYEGVVPDIITSAKGLSAAYLPISVVGMSKKIQTFFQDTPLGWGATYQGHPVAMACAYECIKHMIEHDLVGNAARLQPVMIEGTSQLIERHPSCKRGRAIGLFGAIDLCGPDGKFMQSLAGPAHSAAAKFKQALLDEGVFGFVRPPFLHTAPALVISEAELRDGFSRVDRALDVLDESLGF
ncbi:hypothetical protein AB1Y20_017265 [Prymnesium parvum]|uniref:Aminotransferase class-III n=1 Tax=Prymnesium parvum TaxID=97485 RepID=A0AB34JNN5_PRYPA